MKLVPALSQHAEKFPFCVTLVANRALFRRRHAWLHLRAKVQVFQGNFNFVNPVELFSFVPGEKKYENSPQEDCQEENVADFCNVIQQFVCFRAVEFV